MSDVTNEELEKFIQSGDFEFIDPDSIPVDFVHDLDDLHVQDLAQETGTGNAEERSLEESSLPRDLTEPRETVRGISDPESDEEAVQDGSLYAPRLVLCFLLNHFTVI